MENQTDLIVRAIQSLLGAMKQSTSFGSEFQETIGEITSIVALVTDTSRQSLTEPQCPQHIRTEALEILEEMEAVNGKLEDLGQAIITNPDSKNVKQKLASSSYEIAKHIKALISLLE